MNMFDFVKHWMYESYQIQYLTDEQIIDLLERNNLNPEDDSQGWIILLKPNLEKKEIVVKLIGPDFSIIITETLPILIDVPEREEEIIDLTQM